MTIELNHIYNIDCLEGINSLPSGHRYCIVTDPPFNIGYHYNNYSDNKSEDEYYEWLAAVVKNYPCVIVHYPENLYKFAFHIGKFPERVLSWVYNSNTARQHRDIAYFGVKPDLRKVLQPFKNPTDKRIKARIAAGIEGCRMYDWMNVNQVKNVSKKGLNGVIHPCQMPVEVMRRVVGVLPDDMVIVDPFIGSGTTALGCIAAKRHYIGFELDKDYYDIAIERIREATVKPIVLF